MTALLSRSQRISNYAYDDLSPHLLFSGSLVPAMRPLTSMCWGPLPSEGMGPLRRLPETERPTVLLYDNLDVKMPRFS
jgi:hypothetical protein